jgi:hypothetical protein
MVQLCVGIFLGVGIGLNIGLWLGSHLQKKWSQPLVDGRKKEIDDLKKEIDYWYKNFCEQRDGHLVFIKTLKELHK